MQKNCLVCQVLYFDCNFVYIGQTKRELKSCLTEQKRANKFQRPEKSAYCEHTVPFDHKIYWDNTEILKLEPHYFKRLTSEPWFQKSTFKIICVVHKYIMVYKFIIDITKHAMNAKISTTSQKCIICFFQTKT